jgi:N-acetylglucosamine-6-phosphate deacetylase
MIVLVGGELVLPDRIVSGSLIIEGDRIAAIDPRARIDPAGATQIDVSGHVIVPGFIDVHVHGVDGHDTLDTAGAIKAIAARLPRYGVTAFCPTTVACAPSDLRRMLEEVRALRLAHSSGSARVLPAHLESNFINPEYCGAQPLECLRLPAKSGSHSVGTGSQNTGAGSQNAGARSHSVGAGSQNAGAGSHNVGAGSHDDGAESRNRGAGSDLVNVASGFSRKEFSGADILDVIAAFRPDVGIVTLAPELEEGIDLVRRLVAAGHRVSLGHSGASFDMAIAAIEAGASHATHLFNRMTPMTHRAPGLVGAILEREDVAAELICDGHHVHPAMCRMAIAAKGTAAVMAITDGTAGSGLPVGSTARLGGREIRVESHAAVLQDGTLAGSTLTMDGAFRTIVRQFGMNFVDAATLCATTPARRLGLVGLGMLTEGSIADVVVLDDGLRVVRTFIAGQEVFRST